MALTFTLDDRQLVGNKRQVAGTVTFDSSYATGGETFTAADLGLSSITDVSIEDASGYNIFWNRSTTAPTLQVFQGDNTNVAAAPGIQVPNATNLSTLTTRIKVTGY